MAARVFDTYMPGGEDPFITFINSISDGRILCLAIMVRNFSKLCKKKKITITCVRVRRSFANTRWFFSEKTRSFVAV